MDSLRGEMSEQPNRIMTDRKRERERETERLTDCLPRSLQKPLILRQPHSLTHPPSRPITRRRRENEEEEEQRTKTAPPFPPPPPPRSSPRDCNIPIMPNNERDQQSNPATSLDQNCAHEDDGNEKRRERGNTEQRRTATGRASEGGTYR